MMLTGYDHFDNHLEPITADVEHWRKCAYRNFDTVLKIIISTKNNDNNKCVICGDLSMRWKNKSSLAGHYRFSHRSQIVEYYLENIIQLSPEELQEQMHTEDVE